MIQLLMLICLWLPSMLMVSAPKTDDTVIPLPSPVLKGELSLEETLNLRRSVRQYSGEPITIEQVSQILWAAQGITDRARGFRTAPSAGATFPLEIYVAVADVKGLEPGVYKYLPRDHSIRKTLNRDIRRELTGAALNQPCILNAPAAIVITGVVERTAGRYGERALRYVYMEAGHVAQNISLQTVALGLGTVVVGAFRDAEVHSVVRLPADEIPLYLMPVGNLP